MEPPHGDDHGRTLCEINCQLVSIKTGRGGHSLPGPACPDIFLTSGDQAAELEGHVPTVLVTVTPGQLPRGRVQGSRRRGREGGLLRYLLQQLLSPLPGLRSRLQAATGLQLQPASAAAPLAWHQCRPLLAAADGADRVRVYDFTGSVPSLGQAMAGAVPPHPLSPSQLLYHEFQRGVAALAWRPNSGGTLAAACAHGVCLWRLGGKGPLGGAGGGGGGSARAEGGTVAAGGRVGGAWMSWLQPPPGAGQLTCLAWHPSGHLLAAASAHGAGFYVWDVASGACTPLRAGTEPVSLLSWSPCGSYLLAAHPTGNFRVWQTHSWWPLKWSVAEGSGSKGAAGGGGLAGACWSPDSRMLLLAYAAAPQQLVSLNFTAEPPSLLAQLLPLSLPEIASSANGSGSGGGAVIESMAWDPRAQRLAVAVGGRHPAAGQVALYDTRCDPILSANFVGFATVGPLAQGQGAASARQAGGRAAAGSSEIEEEQGEADQQGGAEAEAEAGRERAPIRLSFQPSFGQGALLAVRQGDHISTLPLYFSS